MTIFSPKSVGRHDTRRSISLPPTCVWMRTSCGMRRSAMDMLDWILSRLMIEAARSVGLPVSLGFTCEFAADGANVMLLGNHKETLAETLDALAIV